MKKKKTAKSNYLTYILIILVILIGFLVYIKSPFHRVEETLEDNSIFTYITPTIIPSQKENWSTFIHPLGNFNFNYPSEWNMTVEKHKLAENWYDIQLSGRYRENDFRIYFQINGRDYPDYQKKHFEKLIGNKKVSWTILYRDNIAIEEFVTFPNSDFGDKLLGLYIYMPKNNQDEFNKIVEEIVASLYQ